MPFFQKRKCLLFCFLMLLLGCDEDETSKPKKIVAPVVYTCGSLDVDETCISLNMPDNFSKERHFILNKSEAITEPAPLFFVLHGSGGRAASTVDRFQFRHFIRKNGFIGVFPNAIVREDGVSTWNAHNDTYDIPHIDDVNFIREVIDKVVTEYNGDAGRVYLFGWSNGGFMSNRLACELPDYINAIYTLAGNLRTELNGCSLAGNVAVHHLHPTGDITVPFNGDSSKGYITAETAIQRWAAFNHCDNDPLITPPFDLTIDEVGEESITHIYQNCGSPTEFTIINGSDHGPEFHNDVLHQEMLSFFQKSDPLWLKNR